MITDPNGAIRVVLQADLAAITPQVTALQAFIKIAQSPDVVALLNDQLSVRIRWQQIITSALNSLNSVATALAAYNLVGYPPLPEIDAVTQAIIFEETAFLNKEISLAAGIFGAATPPVAISLDVAHAVFVKQPRPAN